MILGSTSLNVSCVANSLTLGDLDKPFLMYVEDVFSISGRGTVATGKVERGVITKGSEVEIVGLGNKIKTTLTGIGTFHVVWV